MGRNESKGYDSAIGEKANTKLARTLQSLITDSQALAKHLGCSIQAVNQYKQGTAFPKVENLIKIADYYDISVDYLFGITGTKNRNTQIQAICEYTGLSEENVAFLNKMKSFDIVRIANVINFVLDDARLGDGNTRPVVTLLNYFLEYRGDHTIPKQVDTHGRITDYVATGFMSSDSILIDRRIIENAVLDELKQRLIDLKGEKDNGKL